MSDALQDYYESRANAFVDFAANPPDSPKPVPERDSHTAEQSPRTFSESDRKALRDWLCAIHWLALDKNDRCRAERFAAVIRAIKKGTR
jgi:hypothetical protein